MIFLFMMNLIFHPINKDMISYRAFTLVIIILQLLMHDRFDIMGIVIDISCHTTDLGNWNVIDKTSKEYNFSQLRIYFFLYAFRYYVVYCCLFRPMLNQSKQKNFDTSKGDEARLNHAQNVRKGGLYGLIKCYSSWITVFYCIDIPIGSYNFLIDDPVLKVILKWHI